MNRLTLPKRPSVNAKISRLIDVYWDKEIQSEAQSSFWKYYASMASVKFDQDKGDFFFKGTMFGDFKSKSFLKGFLPATLYAKRKLKSCTPQMRQSVLKVCEGHDRLLSFDCFKQWKSIEKLIEHHVDLKHKTICVIGDGYGFLGCLLKSMEPSIKIISVNLGKISVIDAALTAKLFPDHRISFVEDHSDYNHESDFTFVPAEVVFECGIDNVDIFMNIASMQEMKQETINQYFYWMRSQTTKAPHFYCCNRVSKTLPDGETITFAGLGWQITDKQLLDESCPWYQGCPTNKPPFWAKFDGEMWHRLSILKKIDFEGS